MSASRTLGIGNCVSTCPKANIPMKILRLWWCLVSLSLTLAACASPASVPTLTAPPAPAAPTAAPTHTPSPAPSLTSPPTASPAPSLTPLPQAFGPTNFPPAVNPLTGLPVADPALLSRPPIFVKIANFPRESRPQSGLAKADLVFNDYIGEGTDRFTAVYYGQDAAKVGPIRSARRVDAQLVRMYQGLLAYAGADPERVFPLLDRHLGQRAVNAAPATCPALCDVGPHTVFSVFADTALLSRYAAEERKLTPTRPNLDGMAFDPQPPSGGLEGAQASVTFNAFNKGLWKYDPTVQRYLRWQESVGEDNSISMLPLTDRAAGLPLAFDNVIVAFAPYETIAPTLLDITIWYNQDGRRAVLFRNGTAYEGIWRAPSADRPMQFWTPQGQPLALKPGNTWIVLAGVTSTLTQDAPGIWNMTFSTP